jgi:hypothetical protein
MSRLDPWRIGILGVVLVAVVGVVGAVLVGGGSGGNYTCAQELSPGGSATDGQVTPLQGRGHVATGTRLEYLLCPPASGQHYSEGGVAPARPGFYDASSDIGPGSWVHNLEHGYIVALYRCDENGCPPDADLAGLRRFINDGPQTASASRCGIRSKVLAARFDEMSTPFALLAWNRVLLLEAFDPSAAVSFAQRWMEVDAPEASSC